MSIHEKDPTPAADRDQPATPLQLNSTTDLVALVPYLMGFEPREDLVVVLMADRRVQVTFRMDVDALVDPDQVAARILGTAQRQRLAPDASIAVVLIAYSREERFVADLAPLLLDVMPCPVMDLIRADGRHWWSLLSPLTGHPEEDQQVPYDRRRSTGAARAVAAGLTVQPSREALADLLGSPEESDDLVDLFERTTLELWGRPAEEVLAECQQLVAGARADHCDHATVELAPDEAVRLACALTLSEVRGELWTDLRRAEADADRLLWLQVLEHTSERFRPQVLCLLATACWLGGDGAMMAVCLEAAEAMVLTDPTLEPALLGILQMVQADGHPPSMWESDLLPLLR